MKKLIALVICAVMVLSMIPAMALTASAAGEGMWTTVRRGNDYDDPESYKPSAGYHYTAEGFQTISADFTDITPGYAIQTKEAVNLKDGVHVEFRIDQFSYGGEDGTADHWLALSIWDREKLVPGNTNFGNGWLCLLRGAGEGSAQCQSFWTDMTDKDNGVAGGFTHLGTTNVEAPMDENDCEKYTLDVEYVNGGYVVKVNGVEIAGNANVSNKLLDTVSSGDYYIALSFHTGVKGGVGDATILNYNGSVPTGNDSKEPEDNVNVTAPFTPADQVPVNMPALLLDATHSSSSKDPEGGNIQVTAMGDNSYKLEPSAGSGYVSWGISHKYSFKAEDFPVFCVLTKDFYANMSIRYGAGEIMSADDVHNIGLVPEEDYGPDDEYTMGYIDFSEEGMDWEGRINFARFDFGGVMEGDEYYICFAGFFRSVEEATAYTINYLTEKGVISADETQAETSAETTPETKGEDATSAETKAEETKAEGATSAETKTDETKAEETYGGCASVIGGIAVLAAAMAAAVALKKKN